MSLSKYNKIPKGITIKEAYGKIRNYYQQLVNSPDKPKWLDQKTEDYISSLSEPAKVSNKEIRNLFREVLSGCLESGYNYDDGDYAICTYAKAVYDLNHDCFKLDEDVKPFNRTLTHLTTNPGSIKDKNFAGFSSLESITIFDPDSVLSIGYGAFFNCSSLISIKIPNSVTSIGYCAFSHCSSLISVTIPNGVKSIENSVFHGCSSLMRIAIPDSVTTIDWGAFRSCSSLKNIKIPNGVTSIGE
ncbi:MAG: leucine-rich repeat domain-containing protein, partial [Acholeplasmatales bacterium]|nr:leucine-rich repeat domain-containing protein [Acholeplasmatales bacterium]